MRKPTIVAMGGFPDAPLVAHVLSLAGGRRVLFDWTASPQYAEPLAWPVELTVLSFYPWPPPRLRELVLAQDLVVVGGGNTANMLAVWRTHGFDAVLREAWEAGIPLCGWSAGAICWFEAGVTDSFSPQLDGMPDGLGFIPGSACPHYDGEELRRPVYRELVATGFPPGLAMDDAAAVVFEGTTLAEVISTRTGATAYRVDAGSETPLPARILV